MQVNMHQAKSQLSALAEKAHRGERVIIAKAGKPYLELVPYQAGTSTRSPGGFRKQIRLSKDFDETPESVLSDFEGRA